MKYLFLTFILTGCSSGTWVSKFKCDNRKVIEVGGCGHSGFCAVKLNDGSKEFMSYPIKGEHYCGRYWIKQ